MRNRRHQPPSFCYLEILRMTCSHHNIINNSIVQTQLNIIIIITLKLTSYILSVTTVFKFSQQETCLNVFFLGICVM